MVKKYEEFTDNVRWYGEIYIKDGYGGEYYTVEDCDKRLKELRRLQGLEICYFDEDGELESDSEPCEMCLDFEKEIIEIKDQISRRAEKE